MSDGDNVVRFPRERTTPPELEVSVEEIKEQIRGVIYASVEREVNEARKALLSLNPLRWRKALVALIRVVADPRIH